MLFGQLVTPERLQDLQTVCQTVYDEVLPRRKARLEALAANWRQPTPVEASPRVAVLAYAPHAAAAQWATLVSAAARMDDWPVVQLCPQSSDDMHPLGPAEQLAAFSPHVTICVSHAPDLLHIPLPGRVVVWHTNTQLVGDAGQWDTLHLAASPRILQALQDAGVPADRCAAGYWAVAGETLGSEPAWDPDGPIVLLGDVPNIDPTAHDIRQPAHCLLWQAMLQEISRRAATVIRIAPATFLAGPESPVGWRQLRRGFANACVTCIRHISCPPV
jgi:hypothetical protein